MESVLSIGVIGTLCYRYNVEYTCQYVDDDRKYVIDKSQYNIYRLLLSETVVHVLSITVIENCCTKM